jgi:hypothetical protein
MPRRPAKVTQADIARAIRAVLQVGAGTVTIKPDGSIEVDVHSALRAPSVPVEQKLRRVF